MAVPAAVVALSLSTVPVLATAAPAENTAKSTDSAKSTPLGHAIGSAGTLLSVIRALPGSTPPNIPIPIPGLGGGTNGTPLSLGFGLSSAQANSEVDAPKSLAEAAPFAGSLNGMMPNTPGSATQSAPPDNKTPKTGGFDIPDNPLITGGLLNTSAHARYSDTLGPCVSPLAAAKTSTADLSVLSAIPALPNLNLPSPNMLKKIDDIRDLSKFVNLDKLSQITGVPNNPKASAEDNPLNGLLDSVKQLLGMFDNLGNATDGAGLAKLPGTLSTESTVNLVPIKGSKNKAVQSTSKVQTARIELFSGTPLNLEIRLTSQPTLQVTSTGKKETSTIKYTKPLFSVYRDGQPIYNFDPNNPLQPPMLPLNLLPVGSQQGNLSFGDLDKLAKVPGYQQVAKLAKQNGSLPLIGDATQAFKAAALPDPTSFNDIDLGVIRLQVGAQTNTGETKRKGVNKAPFTGYQLGSKTRLLNVQILPTDVVKALPQLPNLPTLPGLGDALAEFSIGEQTASAYAPRDGVNCGVKQVTNPQPPAKKTPPKNQPSPPLAYTDAAYQTMPLLWTGAGLVLAGAALVGFRPLRRSLAKARRQQ